MRPHARRLRTLAVLSVSALLLPACSAGGGDDADRSSEPRAESAQAESEQGEHEYGETAGESEEEGAEEAEGWSEGMEEQAESRGVEMPEDAFLFRRLMPSGVPSRSTFAAAERQAGTLQTLAAKASPTIARRAWSFKGPRNVGGRVVDGVVDPTRPDSIYVATSTNGVWRSTDSGQTFTNVWPDDLTHAMGALAITPDGTLYAGTGETNPGGGSITYGGDGVYRSTDGGDSWRRVGLQDSSTIGRIVVDPTDPDRIWVAVSGNLFVPGGQRGVYVTTDGGDTWERSLAPPNDTTGATDVAVDPADPDHLIATQWDHIRRPDARVYTGVGSGVWETTDGGDTWQRLGQAQGLPAASPDTGRIGVAFAPSQPDRVYMIYANDETGAFEDFFVSDDNGASWRRPAGAADLTDSQSVYGWWFGRVFVDPDDADRVFALGLDIWQSTDGAASFEPMCCVHADQHIMMWDPKAPDRIYAGNDGGLFVSETDGAEDSWTHSDDQPWSQYAGLDVSEQDPTRIIGGLQDNGTRATWTSPPFGSVYGGDGQRALIDPTDVDNFYACSQYGFCSGFDGADSYRLQTSSARYPYYMQMEFDPSNPEVMYAGGNRLNRSTDGGRTFTPITGDLGKGEAGDEPNPIYRGHYGTISTVAVAPSDPDTIWVGTDNGYLYRSTDGGDSWTELPAPVRPKLWIQRVVVDPQDSKTVYLTFSGYREGDNAPYVLRSRNGGASWTDISANLPHAPVNDLAVVDGRLYVATDVGVFTAASAHPRWFAFGSGMPRLIVTDLRYVPGAKQLFASTFGMGVWSIKT